MVYRLNFVQASRRLFCVDVLKIPCVYNRECLDGSFCAGQPGVHFMCDAWVFSPYWLENRCNRSHLNYNACWPLC